MKGFPSNTYEMEFPRGEAVSFDAVAFDEAIGHHGVKLLHYRAMRCPVGMIDQYDQRRPHDDHAGCSNGFLYTLAGEVTGLFVGNGTNTRQIDAGLLDGSTVQTTLPRQYDNGEEVFLATYDRIFFKDDAVPVINWQLFQYNPAGVNKMQYPVVGVEHLVDASGIAYREGADFRVVNGQIHWIGNTPGMELKTGKGLVCSIRYRYMPFWYVKQIMHEVRVAQMELDNGQRGIMRMPYQVLLQREYVFENEDNDPQAPQAKTTLRQVKAPGTGSFGAR